MRTRRATSLATKRLQVAAVFANIDLREPRAVSRWAAEIWHVFLRTNAGGPIAFDARAGGPFRQGSLTAKQLLEMQQDVRRILTTVANFRAATSGESVQPQGVQIQALEIVPVELAPGRLMLWMAGSAPDVFRYALVRALEDGGIEKIQRCPDHPTCANFFIKVGRKHYCSSRCQSRVQMRARRRREREAVEQSLQHVQRERRR